MPCSSLRKQWISPPAKGTLWCCRKVPPAPPAWVFAHGHGLGCDEHALCPARLGVCGFWLEGFVWRFWEEVLEDRGVGGYNLWCMESGVKVWAIGEGCWVGAISEFVGCGGLGIW